MQGMLGARQRTASKPLPAMQVFLQKDTGEMLLNPRFCSSILWHETSFVGACGKKFKEIVYDTLWSNKVVFVLAEQTFETRFWLSPTIRASLP